MDFKQIQELIKIINKSNIGEISVEEPDFKITIKQKEESVQTIVAAAPTPQVYAPAPVAAPTVNGPAAPAPASPKQDNLLTIKSPMIGTFYRRSSRKNRLFAEVGMRYLQVKRFAL